MRAIERPWTRRRFLQTASLAAAAQSVVKFAHASLQHEKTQPTHAYAAVQGRAASGIQVFQFVSNEWKPIQFVRSVSPSTLALHSTGTHLFVANARKRFEGLPTASIESFRIDPKDGTLRLQQRQRLALASVLPSAMALSPDQSLLVVAAANGIFNVMPLGKDGELGEVTAVRKEIRQSASTVQAMHFTGTHRLVVQADGCLRAYRCTRDGITLMDDDLDQEAAIAMESPAFALPEIAGLTAAAYV